MLSVATTIELSPSVYEGRKLSPKTSTVTRAAKRALSRPVTGDSGIDRSPVSGVRAVPVDRHRGLPVRDRVVASPR